MRMRNIMRMIFLRYPGGLREENGG